MFMTKKAQRHKILSERPKDKYYDLIVRGIPFGGHNNGKDADGEFFHEGTEISSHPVPVMYAHGRQLGFKGGVLGITEDIWRLGDGYYYGVNIFDEFSDLRDRFRKSADEGMLYASIGSLQGGELDVDKATGAINKVVVAELSLIDKVLTPEISPKNMYAVARTKAVANFAKAGISMDACKCGCGLIDDSETLLNTKCTGDKEMTLLEKVKALIGTKGENAVLEPSELQGLLDTKTKAEVVTTTDDITAIVKSAVDSAVAGVTAQFEAKITELNTNFNTQIGVMKATSESTAFNKYLGSLLNVKLTANDVAHYNAIFESVAGLPDANKNEVVAKLKAQIEEKPLITDLLSKGVKVVGFEVAAKEEIDEAELQKAALRGAEQLYGKGSAEYVRLSKAVADGGAK